MGELGDINETTLINILSKIVDEMKDWIIISNRLGRIIYANHSVFKDCLCTKEQVIGEDLCMFVGVDLTDGETLKNIKAFIEQDKKVEFITNRFIEGNRRVYLENTLTSIWGNDALEYYVCVSKDISNTIKLKEAFYKANYLDPLTNYPNQNNLFERLDKQVFKGKQIRNPFALILLDIESIGEINNYYGISMGDFIIKEVGKRIKGEMNSKQEIFKYTGNVFAILHKDLMSEDEVNVFLHKVHEAMEKPIQVQSRHLYVRLKIGIALYPEDALGTHQLIEMAQVALGHAKKQKKRTEAFTYYSKTIHEEAQNTKQVEKELQKAVENDEFIVYYQPFVDLREEQLVGMEALIRRQTQDGKIISPGTFIGTLERMNLMERVGTRVIEKVCVQIREWLDKGYHVVPVSINLSPLQFRNPQLAYHIKAILDRYDIEPCYVVLEITETTLMEEIEVAKVTIETLRDYGFAISIDDFGTGYASIGYLKKFMFDHLKIDISFIREIVKSNEDRAIVEAIIAIAKTLHLKTIAEGIENEEQLYIISALGCEMGQGYFWDQPINSKKIEEKYFMTYR